MISLFKNNMVKYKKTAEGFHKTEEVSGADKKATGEASTYELAFTDGI